MTQAMKTVALAAILAAGFSAGADARDLRIGEIPGAELSARRLQVFRIAAAHRRRFEQFLLRGKRRVIQGCFVM